MEPNQRNLGTIRVYVIAAVRIAVLIAYLLSR